MNLNDIDLYISDLKLAAELDIPWKELENKSILVVGATGLIGSFLIDVLMFRNTYLKMNCTVYALGRNYEKAKNRFQNHFSNSLFNFISHDINTQLNMLDVDVIDYIFHLASNTHPIAYAKDPIGTITTNIFGTKNLLDFALLHKSKRVIFASSNEIYGENRGDVDKFDELYCGYIDSNTLRAGYPESKRCSEALCQAYINQKGLDIIISRLTRSYGPTMLLSDSKAVSQFILNAISGEDIVLKSKGNQYYSYTYVSDAVSGLLTILLCGVTGQAYNISDEKSDITLKDLATLIAVKTNKKVIFDIPSSIEKTGYSKVTKARLENKKIKSLGWNAKYDIRVGISRTIDILIKLMNN